MTAMVRALTVTLAVVLASGIAPTVPAARAAGEAAAVIPQYPAQLADPQAERELLDLTNQARSDAGVAPLQQNEGLTQAARAHAAEMAAQEQASHQFSNEPSLTQRIAIASDAHLDRAGENVAYAATVDRVENVLLNSPPHRENLLNAGYNIVGIGAVRNGNTLYVTEDFGHELPSYSAEQAKQMIAEKILQIRSQEKLPALQIADTRTVQADTCDMAQADSLNVSSPQGRYVLRYTAALPDNIPSSVSHAVSDRSIHSFAVGACYARTARYPSGVYWVMLAFY